MRASWLVWGVVRAHAGLEKAVSEANTDAKIKAVAKVVAATKKTKAKVEAKKETEARRKWAKPCCAKWTRRLFYPSKRDVE